jgi:hypothetical protein
MNLLTPHSPKKILGTPLVKCNKTFEGKTTHQKNNNSILNFFCLCKTTVESDSFVVPWLALDGFSWNFIWGDFY